MDRLSTKGIDSEPPAVGQRPSLKVDIQGRERLVTLAPGTVRPTGWMRTLAQLEADNWLEMIIHEDKWNLKKSFYDGSETPHGGEWAGYWNDAFIGLSLVLGDEHRLNRVRTHIEEMLAAADQKPKFLSEWYNAWGAHLHIRALLTWFEATGDERVLKLCHRVVLELREALSDQESHAFDGDHQVNMAASCAQLYGYTGDTRLLDMAIEIMSRFDAGGLPNLKRLLNDDRLYGHCVNYCEDIRHPAEVYLFSGNPDHLKASVRGVELTYRDHMQVQGVPTGNEPVNGKGPMKETEHCDTVEWSFVGHALLAATGEVKYADLAEKAFLNAWAGSRKWNARSLCYNHAPNQITASSWEGTWVPRMCYSPYHQPQCCNLNSHRIVHPYINRMWMLNPDTGLTAVYYGSCRLLADVQCIGMIEIIEESDYPFGEEVRIIVNPEAPASFPIKLRIPGWCGEAVVLVNGMPVEGKPQSGSFFTIRREWKEGDRIDLKLPMPIRLEWCETFEEPAFHDPNHLDANPEHTKQIGLRPIAKPIPGRHFVAVSRGPLVYALYLKHESIIEPFPGEVNGYPVESFVPAKDCSPWNVAIILDKNNPERSFEFVGVDTPGGALPFQHPPVALRGKGKMIPEWKAAGEPGKSLTTLPPIPYEASGDEVDVLLVPFGCTRIRLTWLPFIMR